MKTIKELPSQEYLKSVLDYNSESGEFHWKYRSDLRPNDNARLKGEIAGYVNGGYWKIKIDDAMYLGHRLAWVYMYGDILSDAIQIDHKNLKTTQNNIDNLRVATHRQNAANSSRRKNKNLPKGVTKQSCFSQYGGYLSRITLNYKTITLGTFRTVEEAHDAYNKTALEYYGEFARVA